MIQKLLKQFGTYGNEYSPLEMGDKINELIDYLFPEEKKVILQNIETDEIKEMINPIIVEPEVVDNTAVPPTRSYAVRSQSTADKVYLIKDGKKYWIKNPETLNKLGFTFQTIKNITNEEMAKLPSGEPIDMKDYEVSEVPEQKEDGNTYNL